jgi:DNA phosphorothioation system restriction enzyme
LAEIVKKSFVEIHDLLRKQQLNALAWLVAEGLLDVKLALRVTENGRFASGIYHEKIGIFSDELGNHVAFSGSSNETFSGLSSNFESIKVFWSWEDTQGRVREECGNFDRLWCNQTGGVKVLEFTDQTRHLLARYQTNSKPTGQSSYLVNSCPGSDDYFRLPQEINLRTYQKEAINNWFKNKNRGILAMATGSGKTITAISIAVELYKQLGSIVVIVLCPFINLAEQWFDEFKKCGIKATKCYENRRNWRNKVATQYYKIESGLSSFSCFIASNDTFKSNEFQALFNHKFSSSKVNHILIADEVHNLGSEKAIKALPESIGFRLGLSATPERHMDLAGSQKIIDYFGKVVFEYDLKQAISAGYLASYIYKPVIVKLDEEEAEEYVRLTTEIGKIYAIDDGERESPALKILLYQRSRLLASVKDKLTQLNKLISKLEKTPKKVIFYCGDGKSFGGDGSDSDKQIKSVMALLGEKHGIRLRYYTHRETNEERCKILSELKDGYIDGVVAIRCLDEGIDIPELRIGFILASTSNPRQFIQRRGRLLRLDGTNKRATIYDFIVAPPDLDGDYCNSSFNWERRMFSKELARIKEFCHSAINGPEAIGSIRPLLKKYNLLSHSFMDDM